jgi:nitroimidazol reductase NimA-like FMN-containing flavoprotein (pyridoxamine 5'-phosphate oxidase superfamily)
MHKKEKEIINPDEIEEILTKNTICRITLSLNDTPYLLPMNYGYENSTIYLHTAMVGKKIDIINQNNYVCFEISDSIELVTAEVACGFTTNYRSIIGFGNVTIVEDTEKKIEALLIIMKQHTGNMHWELNSRVLEKTGILKIEIESITGKKSKGL